MQKKHEFLPADRYTYDFGLCSAKNGFAQLDTDQDAHYFGQWANPVKRIIFQYVEGDCYTIICETDQEFRNEIDKIAQWTNENDSSFKIDAYKTEAGWRKIGLGHYLH